MPLSKQQRRLLFQMLGGFLFLCGTLLIIFFNYLLVHPFIVPIGWALCSSLAMRPMNRAILSCFHAYSRLPWKIRAMFVATIWSLYFYWLAWIVYHFWVDIDVGTRALLIFLAALLAIILLLPSIMELRALSATILMASLGAGIVLTVLVFSKLCFDESLIASDLVRQIITENQATLSKLQNTTAMMDLWSSTEKLCKQVSPMALWLPETVNGALLGDKAPELWCSEHIDGVKANLETYYEHATTFAQQGAVWLGTALATFFASATSSLTSIPLSLFIYTTFLFTFLKYEDQLETEIAALAPLDPGETNQMVASLYEKVVKTIGLTLIEAVLAFAATLTAFTMGGFKIKWVFAFAAGFLELIPFGTPWVVWLPSLAWAIARDGIESEPWLVMIGIYLGLQLIVIPLIAMFVAIEKQNPVIINISLVLGFYSWGSYGVLLGPMVAGASLVLVELYKNYASAPPAGAPPTPSRGKSWFSTPAPSRRPSTFFHSQSTSALHTRVPSGSGHVDATAPPLISLSSPNSSIAMATSISNGNSSSTASTSGDGSVTTPIGRVSERKLAPIADTAESTGGHDSSDDDDDENDGHSPVVTATAVASAAAAAIMAAASHFEDSTQSSDDAQSPITDGDGSVNKEDDTGDTHMDTNTPSSSSSKNGQVRARRTQFRMPPSPLTSAVGTVASPSSDHD